MLSRVKSRGEVSIQMEMHPTPSNARKKAAQERVTRGGVARNKVRKSWVRIGSRKHELGRHARTLSLQRPISFIQQMSPLHVHMASKVSIESEMSSEIV